MLEFWVEADQGNGQSGNGGQGGGDSNKGKHIREWKAGRGPR